VAWRGSPNGSKKGAAKLLKKKSMFIKMAMDAHGITRLSEFLRHGFWGCCFFERYGGRCFEVVGRGFFRSKTLASTTVAAAWFGVVAAAKDLPSLGALDTAPRSIRIVTIVEIAIAAAF